MGNADIANQKNNVYVVGRRRKLSFALIFGILLAFCYTAGRSLDLQDSLDLTEGRFYLQWLTGAIFAAVILFFLWEMADRSWMLWAGKGRAGKIILEKCKFLLPYWGCVLVLLICWIPAWLSLFPGAFSYDALAEWEQVRDGMITAHHPVVHVLWLGGLVEGGHALTGSYNVGIAVYTGMQMFILANLLARTLSFMKEFKVPDILQWFALLFYGLSPVVQLFAISATKDVLFSGALLIFLLDLMRVYCREDVFFNDRKSCLLFGTTAFFSMVMRNNGLYITVITLAVAVLTVKKYRRKMGLIFLGICVAYGIYVGPVYGMLHVSAGGIEEMLSVPIQQMARVHRYDYDSLEHQDLELLYRVIPKEFLEEYRPTVSDFVKKGFQRDAFEVYKWDMLKLWIRWGMEHPLTYVNSFLINTVDFWYPHGVVDGYRDVYGRSSFFDYKVDRPGTEIVFLPKLHDYYEKLSFDKQAQTAPFAFLVLSPGWYFVMTMLMAGYMWRCRRKEFFLPGVVFVISTLTVFLGPMALVRYVLIFYFAFPVMLSVCMLPGQFTKDNF